MYSTSVSDSQSFGWNWIKPQGLTGDVRDVVKLASLHDTYFYVLGEFEGKINANGSDLTSYGHSDVFLAKMNTQGRVMWIQVIGGSSPDYALNIAVCENGTVAVTGVCNGSAIIGGKGVSNDMGVGRFAYVALFDTSGVNRWVNKIDGDIVMNGIDVSNDIVVLTGYSGYGSVRFESDIVDSTGIANIYWAVYEAANGKFVRYFRTSSQNGNESERGGVGVVIASDQNLYSVGFLNGSTVFSERDTLNADYPAAFVSKHNASGDLEWLKKVGGVQKGTSFVSDISVLGERLLIAGQFTDTLYLNDTPVVSTNSKKVVVGQSLDALIAEFDVGGNVVWVNNVGGTRFDWASDVDLSPQGNAYLAGNFLSSEMKAGEFQLQENGVNNGFVVEFDKDGRVVSGLSAQLAPDSTFMGVSADTGQSFYVSGTRLIMKGGSEPTSVEVVFDDSETIIQIRDNVLRIERLSPLCAPCTIELYTILGQKLSELEINNLEQNSVELVIPRMSSASVMLIVLFCEHSRLLKSVFVR